MGGPIAAVAFNQPQMKNGPVLLSPNPSNAGSWFGRSDAATECEVDPALEPDPERAQTLDEWIEATWRLRRRELKGYLARATVVAPAQISKAPHITLAICRSLHSAKTSAPTSTATSALLLLNGAMTATGSFSMPKP